MATQRTIRTPQRITQLAPAAAAPVAPAAPATPEEAEQRFYKRYTLDLVAASVEELSASGRFVAIVTHIRELADRVPVRFEVTKDATTSRVARVDA